MTSTIQSPVSISTKTNEPATSANILSKMKVPELRELCKKNGIKSGGKKAELIERINNHKVHVPADRLESKKTTLGKKEVNQLLIDLGQKPETVSNCLKRAIQKGFVKLDGETPLEKVIVKGACIHCEEPFAAKIKDVLLQDDEGVEYDAETGARCPHCDQYQYVTRMCIGEPEFDSGKFHNHCTKCPGFGQCINDYRMSHCDTCNKHYFEGNSGFDCPNCEKKNKKRKRLGGHMDSDDENEDAVTADAKAIIASLAPPVGAMQSAARMQSLLVHPAPAIFHPSNGAQQQAMPIMFNPYLFDPMMAAWKQFFEQQAANTNNSK